MTGQKAVGILTAGLALAAAAGLAGAPEGGGASKDRIAQLVRELGADDVKAREAATRELETIGGPAAAALREAARSDDPEVAWRARTVLDRIDGAGTPARAGGAPGGDDGDRSRLHSFNFRFSPGAENSSVIITQEGDGRIRVTVTEDRDGKRVTKDYEAESPEAFKEKHPDVAKRFGLGEAGRAPRVLRDFVPPGPRLWDDWGFGDELFDPGWADRFGGEIDRLHDRMRRQMDEVLRQHQMDPWGQRLLRRFHERFRGGEEAGKAAPGKPEEGAPEEDRAEQAPAPPPAEAGEPPVLGVRVEEVEPALRDQLQLGADEGARVAEVMPDGRAARAGLRVHDVIVSVNGRAATGAWELRRVIREAAQADRDGTLELVVIRGGRRQTVAVPR